MYKMIRAIVRLVVCHILFRVKYENVEVLEKYEKCMICPNHSRIFDPIFLYPKVENMYSVAKADLFENRMMANFLKAHHAIPIKRNTKDIQGTKKIIELLKQTPQIRLLLFPEGGVFKENYRDNQRNTKNGASYISAFANVPIIPVNITVRPKFFSNVMVCFGEPIFPNLEVLRNRRVLRQEAVRLINHIYEFRDQNLYGCDRINPLKD